MPSFALGNVGAEETIAHLPAAPPYARPSALARHERAAPIIRATWHSSHSSTHSSRSATSRCSITRTFPCIESRAHRPDRPQRRRQVFAAQDTRRAREARRRHAAASAGPARRLCRAGARCWTWTPTCSRPPAPAWPQVIALREQYLSGAPGASTWMRCSRRSKPTTPGTGSSASKRRCTACTWTATPASARCRAAPASAWRSRRRWWPRPTCCCSTSRPTTSTSIRSNGSSSC